MHVSHLLFFLLLQPSASTLPGIGIIPGLVLPPNPGNSPSATDTDGEADFQIFDDIENMPAPRMDAMPLPITGQCDSIPPTDFVWCGEGCISEDDECCGDGTYCWEGFYCVPGNCCPMGVQKEKCVAFGERFEEFSDGLGNVPIMSAAGMGTRGLGRAGIGVAGGLGVVVVGLVW